jgi:PAS domain S-box-containing protein
MNYKRNFLECLEKSIISILVSLQKKDTKGFRLSTDGVIVVDPKEKIIRETNQSVSKLLGYEAGEIIGKSLTEILSPNERERFIKWYEIFISEGRGTLSDVEIFKKDEGSIYCDISGIYLHTDINDNLFFTLKDVTERKRIENDLIEVAQKDELTGLFNRRSFEMQISGLLNLQKKIILIVLSI